jgi:formylglycine-generating enzyme required for sulfatase activity
VPRAAVSLSLALVALACESPRPSTSTVPPPSSSVPLLPTSTSTSTSTSDKDAATASSTPEASAPEAPPDMLLVPAGTFTMGSDSGGEQDERPAHKVTLRAFWLDKTEVTNAAYAACAAANVCRPKSAYVIQQHPDFQRPNQPVSGVSWDDARAYCEWKGKRLPREAEFERAVRDDDGRRFPWGNDPPSPDKSVYSRGAPDDVGSRPAGRGPYGQDDLTGNVWEWQEDEYDPFAYSRPGAAEGKPGSCDEILAALKQLRDEDKQGYTGSNPIPTECEHAIRGGAYNYSPEGLRSTNRVHHPGRFRIPMLGFRCAKDAS